jgi:hypothetical protein
MWTYACQYLCHIENVMVDDEGSSPWILRHGDDFQGDLFPFGCGVHYLPTTADRTFKSKGAPAMQYGVFLGYRLAPGGRWNGEYLVADLDDFIGLPLDIHTPEREWYINPCITEQVKLGFRGAVFPLKPRYEQVNYTLEGREGAMSRWTYDQYGKPSDIAMSELEIQSLRKEEDDANEEYTKPETDEAEIATLFGDNDPEPSDYPQPGGTEVVRRVLCLIII